MSLHIAIGYPEPNGKGEPVAIYVGPDASAARACVVTDKFKSVRLATGVMGYVKNAITTAEDAARKAAEKAAQDKRKAEESARKAAAQPAKKPEAAKPAGPPPAEPTEAKATKSKATKAAQVESGNTFTS